MFSMNLTEDARKGLHKGNYIDNFSMKSNSSAPFGIETILLNSKNVSFKSNLSNKTILLSVKLNYFLHSQLQVANLTLK
jgi:hypothetical protein